MVNLSKHGHGALNNHVDRTQQISYDIRNFMCHGEKWRIFRLFCSKFRNPCFLFGIYLQNNFPAYTCGKSPDANQLFLSLCVCLFIYLACSKKLNVLPYITWFDLEFRLLNAPLGIISKRLPPRNLKCTKRNRENDVRLIKCLQLNISLNGSTANNNNILSGSLYVSRKPWRY